MRMPGGENNHWRWPDASPVVRCIVWAGVGGDHFPYEEFVTSMSQAFGLDGQAVNDLHGRLGAKCMLDDLVPRLQRLEPEEVGSTTAELGELAGGDEHAKRMAGEAAERLGEWDTVEATTSLRSLSAMAANRVARPRFFTQKGWRLTV